MWTRISSRIRNVIGRQILTAGLFTVASVVSAQGIRHDPDTGIAYREVTKTVSRPVESTRVLTRNETVYQPRTVTETRPSMRTIWRPSIEGGWEPYVANRWNPFVRPSIGYRYVTRPKWEATSEVVNHTTTRTELVAETRPVERTETVRSFVQETKTDFEPIGKIAPAESPSQVAFRNRLRPLANDQRIVPFDRGQTSIAANTYAAPPRLASSSVASLGRMQSDPPRRSIGQGGQPATDLVPSAGYGGSLGPPVSPVGIATGPTRILR